MALIKNGTSRYDIKDFMTTSIAPKYFDKIKNLNDLNIGLFGYVTEVLSDVTNDTLFMVSSLYKEIFPPLAELPESIYNHALIYQLSNIFGTPSKVDFTILVAEESVLNNGTMGTNYQYFDIDSNMEFNIDSITFMLDYDIRILSKKQSSGWVHSAQYIINRTNTISGLNNPYIRSSIFVNTNGKRYIMLLVTLHQVSRKSYSDTILMNDQINVVSLKYQFTNQLANFEIFYKGPDSNSYTQLKKQLANSAKLAEPFCFYKLTDDNTLEISFSGDDAYFQPKYNSEVIVEIYTTEGVKGNFESYDGSDIEVVGKFDKYPSNRGIIFMGTVVGSATEGADRKTLEELKNETIKSYSTMKSFSTTNDLNLFFDDVRNKNQFNSEILFMRKRDDVFQRLYSSFILFRDSDNNVIPTNTLDLYIDPNDIDYNISQSSRNVIKAGKVFEFIHDEDSGEMYAQTTDLTIESDLDEFENTNRFIYINPFLTIINTNPLGISFYVNTINDTLPLTHLDENNDSFYQFIANNITIYRNALMGEDEYKFTVKLSPTTMLPKEAFRLQREDTLVEEGERTFVNPTDGYTYVDNNNLKCIVEVLDNSNERKFYVQLELVGFDEEYYFFEGKIKTNDYLSSTHHIQITDGFRDGTTYSPEITDPELIPTVGCRMKVYTLYLNPDGTQPKLNAFNKFEGLEGFTLTDTYYLDDSNLANFAIPVQEINSYVEYVIRNPGGAYGYMLEAVPLVKANYLKIEGAKEAFIKNFKNMYQYIDTALDRLTNNYSIDLKFFNTYGYSQHYYLVESDEHIDKVNIAVSYKVKFISSADKDEEKQQLIEFIKKTVEETKLSLTASPSFYISNLTAKCVEQFPSIQFMDFQGINGYGPEIQSLESDVNESNIIQGIIVTSNVIPEYLNIDYIIKNGERTPQVYIELI